MRERGRPCACARTPSTRWNRSICHGTIRERVARLRAEQSLQRADFARAWERRLEALRTQVRAEVGGKMQRFAITRRAGIILNQPVSG
jgi:hypothetical protein